MKKIILLLGICFCISGVYAQRFESKPIDDGDSFEIRNKSFNKLFGEMFVPEKLAPLVKEKKKTEKRAEWRDKCAKRLITDKLKQVLREVGETEGGGLWVTFYIDETGNVLTVQFMASSTVYVKLPAKVLKELYNMAMKEKFDPSCYDFNNQRTYAVDGFDLMKRAVGIDSTKKTTGA